MKNQNLINEVKKIETEMQRGWPHGTDGLHRLVPSLLRRIAELENALSPFARKYLIEIRSGVTNPDAVSNVFLKECAKAFEMLDPANSQPEIDQSNFFSQPAE